MKAVDRLIPQVQHGDLKGREEQPERERTEVKAEGRGAPLCSSAARPWARCSSPPCLGALTVITPLCLLLKRPGTNAAHLPQDAGRALLRSVTPHGGELARATWRGQGTVHPLLPFSRGRSFRKKCGHTTSCREKSEDFQRKLPGHIASIQRL